jgi:hypothetical protein
MNQNQQPQRWWKDNRLTWALAALSLASLLIITILGYLQRWAWTELLWRWLELLIIPLVLALGALWFNNQTRKSEQVIAEDRAREDSLQRYLDKMSELLLDKNLGGFDKGTLEQIVVSARTPAVIRSLEGDQRGRKSQVVRFLVESNLIGKISLSGADLSHADLSHADLSHANLGSATLSGTDLSHANLTDANLSRAFLSRAFLTDANLTDADLTGADLRNAELRSANLSGAFLSRARGWTSQQLTQAESLVGATLPDGTVMTEEAWEEFKKRYG